MRIQTKNKLMKIFKDSEYLISSDFHIFSEVIKDIAKPFKKLKFDKVMAIDMKGLIYGSVVAEKLKVGFVPILKGGKIKHRERIIKQDFVDYSGKEKGIEIFKDSIKKGDKILLVDDWFDSGNTGRAAIKLIEERGGKVIGISVIFNQLSEKEEKFFEKYNYHFLIRLEPKKKN